MQLSVCAKKQDKSRFKILNGYLQHYHHNRIRSRFIMIIIADHNEYSKPLQLDNLPLMNRKTSWNTCSWSVAGVELTTDRCLYGEYPVLALKVTDYQQTLIRPIQSFCWSNQSLEFLKRMSCPDKLQILRLIHIQPSHHIRSPAEIVR